MDEFLKWMITNPTLINGAVILLGIILLTVLLLYVIAFFQGRNVSFWPPSIGQQPKIVKAETDKSHQVDSRNPGSNSRDSIHSTLLTLLDENSTYSTTTWRFCEKEITQKIKTSKEVRMIKIKGRDLYLNLGFKQAIIERTKAGKFTRILLQSPNSKYINSDVSSTFMWDSPDIYTKEFQTALETLARVISNYKQIVRLYDFLPLLRLYIFDDDIYLSIYSGTIKDNDASNANVWCLSRKTNNFGIATLIERYFDSLWNESIDLSLVQNKCVILENDTYFLSIPISSEQIKIPKEKITLRNKDFLAKNEFHITVIGSSLNSLIKEQLENDHLKRELFLRAIAETNWSYELCDKFYHLVEEKLIDEEGNKTTLHLESIIQLANIPELDQFYKKLETIFQIQIPSRPTHLTLYTFGNQRGIGVNTQSEFDEYSHGEINLQ